MTNPSGSIDSRQAVLTITEDNDAPQFFSARLGADNMTIIVDMNEPLCVDLDGTTCGYNATDAFNWDVINPNNPADPPGAATVVVNNGTNVVITTLNPWTAGEVYRILISDQSSGISDLYGNTMIAFTFIDTLPTVSFQQNVANYTGTQDAEVHSVASAATPLGGNPTLTVDNDDAGVGQALLRFDNIFGNDVGQVPLGAEILTATLELQVFDGGGPVNLHRFLQDWDQLSVTWDSVVGGLTADGVEARTEIDAVVPIATGLLAINVANSVQAWANGEANHGWALISTAGDGMDFNTSENAANPPRLSISFRVPECTTAPQITQDPASATPAEGSTVVLSAGFTGACQSTFQWTKGGSDISGANSPTLTLANVSPADNGEYRLRITNPNGTATSGPATITVGLDTTRPALTRAASTSSTTIVLNFNKALSATTAEDETKYVISGGATVSSAILVNAANSATVTLTTSARGLAASTLTITGVTDNRVSANLINPNPTVVNLTGSSIVTGAEWAGEWLYNTNNLDAAPDWKDVAYVPGADWLTGSALFGTETSAGVVALFPAPLVTVIPPNTNTPPDFVTAYFRKTVTLPALSGGAIYILEHFIDDGAIFYMDGAEFARFQMPAGAVQYSTKSTAAGEATLQSVRLPASASAGGTFTLAVEVHQGGATTSSDMLFGAQVRAVSAPPSLSISQGAGAVSVNWNADSSWRLLGANLVEGPYAAVAGNPFRSFTVPTASQTNHNFYLLQFNPTP